MTNIYIDESGHSGDMIHSGESYDFKGQPYFSLAAVGLSDDYDWVGHVGELRKRYRIPSGEIKSKSLTSKPEFTASLINDLLDHKLPLFVEVVDKRYFICTNITTFQILPPVVGYPESARLHFLRNTVADFVYKFASDEVLDVYVKSCLEPAESTLIASFRMLREMTTQPFYDSVPGQIAAGIRNMVDVAENRYRELKVERSEAWLLFLPPPDLNKHAKHVWMLPNLTSFTNIYARMNRYYEGRLDTIRIVHDQQFEVEGILRHSKKLLENLGSSMDLPHTPGSDYRFSEGATMEFSHSHKLLGLQLADVLAGATMRFFRDVRTEAPVSPFLGQAVMRLVATSNIKTGFGLNQVLPNEHVHNAASGGLTSNALL